MAPAGFKASKKFGDDAITMPAAAGTLAFAQMRREGENLNSVETHQADVAERGGETLREEELFGRARRHGGRGVEQHAHRNAGLDLEHLEEHFVQPHVGAPVDGAEVVAVVEVAMVEKFLAAAGETRAVMAADETGEGTLPVDGQAFQAFEKFPVQQRLARHKHSL